MVVAQVDWGCWVVSVTRQELLELLDRWYGAGPIYPPDWTIRERGNREDNEIRQFVESLDGSTRYLLTALET
ncbi:MAG TPA: hypothetical protein VFY27_13090 [Woeseiaceae bacterium]|nr:hypothetical protein [Woeseiaceae bacterium]